MIATNGHEFQQTLWRFVWHSIWRAAYVLSSFYTTCCPLSEISSDSLFWHFIPHSIWHMFWHAGWHIIHSDIRSSAYSDIYSVIWHSVWHTSFWHILTFYVAFSCVVKYLIWQSIWHFSCHSVWQFVGHRVRAGDEADNLGDDAAGEEEEEVRAVLFKSRDPHLAGGVTLNLPILSFWGIHPKWIDSALFQVFLLIF